MHDRDGRRCSSMLHPVCGAGLAVSFLETLFRNRSPGPDQSYFAIYTSIDGTDIT